MKRICNGLIDENYEYHLSGDCLKFCLCVLTNKRCMGVVVEDPKNQSSQFFSRGKNVVDHERLNKCPMYGASIESFEKVLKEKTELKLQNQLKQMKNE